MPRLPINLYLHLPFCASKCHYCAFFSQAGQEKFIPEYVSALETEIKLYAKRLTDYRIVTIYFGGGTPSLLPAEMIARILATIRANLHVAIDAEISLEANPESITKAKLAEYQRAGINRLSIGLQSWQPTMLMFLNRPSPLADFERVVSLVKQSGISNFSLDLMFGLPNQTLADWQYSLTKTIACQPTHISCYSLELDNHSRFGRLAAAGQLKPTTAKVDRAMYELAKKMLIDAGYQQYEISNFARPGFACEHNLNFWQGGEYLGLGAGAESYWQQQSWTNVSHLQQYIDCLHDGKLPVTNLATVPINEQILQAIALGLRTTVGVNLRKINQQFKLDLASKCRASLQQLQDDNLLIITDDCWRLTDAGQNVIDQIIVKLATNIIQKSRN